MPPGYTVSATLGGNAVRTGLASYHPGAEGGIDWIEPMHDLIGASIAAGTSSPLIYAPVVGNVSSGTYTSGTGATSLTTAAPHGISVGQQFMLYSVASSPQVLAFNGIWTATAGTTGSTLNFTAPTGLGSLSITGGQYDATTRTATDWTALNRVIRLTNLAMWAVRFVTSGGSYTSGTGATTLKTTQPHTIVSGDSFTLFQAGNPVFNGTYTATTGTTGTTINFTAATGLAGGVPTSGQGMFALTGTAADQTGAGNWDWALDGGATNLIETRGLTSVGLMQQITGAFVNTSATPSIGISSISFIAAPAGWNSAIAGFAQVTTSSPHGIPATSFTAYQSNTGAGNNHAFVHSPATSLIGQGIIISNNLGALVPQCEVSNVTTGTSGIIYFSRGGLAGVNINDTVIVGTKFQALVSGVTPAGYNGWFMEAMATGANTFIVPLAANPGAYSSGGTFQQCHRALRGKMEVWATQKADGTLGPIAWKGPFIDNVLLYNTGPGLYTYDLAIRDNGSQVKALAGNMIAAREDNQGGRLDGQWEWTANDPSPVSGGIWVDQDYTFTRKTMKIPSLKDGLTPTYTGLHGGQSNFAPSAVNTSTGVINAAMNSFCPSFNIGNPFPGNAVAFRSTGGLPSPLIADTPYWARSIDNTGTNFVLYASKWDAFRQVNPIALTTQGTGTHTVYACVAPGAAGIYQLGFGQGNTQDDGFYHEADAGRDVGRTVVFNRLARVSAISVGSFCEGHVDGWSGLAPSVLPQSLTPAGMGAGKYWTGTPASSLPLDVNGGIAPTGEGQGTAAGWFNTDTYHRATPLIGTWLLEGGAYLRDKLIARGHFMSLWMVGNAGAAPGRNLKFASINYWGVTGVLRNTSLSKQGGNNLRDKLFAAFVARTMGGPQGAYFGTLIDQEYSAWLAYYTSVADVSYQSTGVVQCGSDLVMDSTGDFTVPGTIQLGAEVMSDYGPNMLGNLAYGTLLNADYHPSLLTLADFSHTLYDTLYTSGSASAYFAPVFYFLMTLKSAKDAGPNKWAAIADMMPVFNQTQSPVSYYKADGTITCMGITHYYTNKFPYGWQLQLNDKGIPLGYDPVQNPGSTSPTPAEYTQGQKLYIRQLTSIDANSCTFKLSTTNDDTGIISTVTPRGGIGPGQLSAAGALTLLSVTDGLFTIGDWLWSGNKADGVHVGSQLGAKITAGSGLSWTTNYSGAVWPRANTTVTVGDSTHVTVAAGTVWVGMTLTCVNAPTHIPAGTTILFVDSTGTIATLSQATTLVNGDTVSFYAGIVAACAIAFSPGANSIAAAPTTYAGNGNIPAYLTNPTGALSYPAQQAAAFAMAAMRGNASATADWNQFNTRNGAWTDHNFARLNLQPSV